MKRIYRIFAINEIPVGLKETISSLHAFAILQSRKKEISTSAPDLNNRRGNVVRQAIGRVRR